VEQWVQTASVHWFRWHKIHSIRLWLQNIHIIHGYNWVHFKGNGNFDAFE
jgi:hypothetical protein